MDALFQDLLRNNIQEGYDLAPQLAHSQTTPGQDHAPEEKVES